MSISLNSGYEMPTLAFGTSRIPDEQCEPALQTAAAVGYRHIDTAAIYRTEPAVGRFLSTVDRSEYFVTTKVWNEHFRNIREACLASLERLNTSYIDLYLLHWPFAVKQTQPPEQMPQFAGPIEQDRFPMHLVWPQMEGLVKEGLVRSIGVSNMPVALLNDLLGYANIPPAVNQIEIHLHNNRQDLIEFCKDNKIAVSGFRCIFRPISDGKSNFMKCGLDEEAVVKLAEKYGKSPAQIILRWVTQRGCAVIVKSVTESRIRENWESQDFELAEEDIQQLNGLHESGHAFYIGGKNLLGISIFA